MGNQEARTDLAGEPREGQFPSAVPTTPLGVGVRMKRRHWRVLAREGQGMKNLLREIDKVPEVTTEVKHAIEDHLFEKFQRIALTRRYDEEEGRPYPHAWRYKRPWGQCKYWFWAPCGDGRWAKVRETKYGMYIRAMIKAPMSGEWYLLTGSEKLGKRSIMRLYTAMRVWFSRHAWTGEWIQLTKDAGGVYFRWLKQPALNEWKDSPVVKK